MTFKSRRPSSVVCPQRARARDTHFVVRREPSRAVYAVAVFGTQASEQMQEGRVYLLVALWLCLCRGCGCLSLDMRQYRAFVALGIGNWLILGIFVNVLVPPRICTNMHLTGLYSVRLLCLLVERTQNSRALIAVVSHARRVARMCNAFAKVGNTLIG